MKTVTWLGPPAEQVALIGVGLVSPGDDLDLVDDLADKLIAEGRAEAIVADSPKKSDNGKAKSDGSQAVPTVVSVDNPETIPAPDSAPKE